MILDEFNNIKPMVLNGKCPFHADFYETKQNGVLNEFKPLSNDRGLEDLTIKLVAAYLSDNNRDTTLLVSLMESNIRIHWSLPRKHEKYY